MSESLVVEWRPIPVPALRRAKTMCEEELLGKLGNDGKRVVHPLIKESTFLRPQSRAVIDQHSFDMSNSPAKSSRIRYLNCKSQHATGGPLKQLSRHGPRNTSFSGTKHAVQQRTLSDVNDEYNKRKEIARVIHEIRLVRVFNTWRGNPGPFVIDDRTLR